jgi:hypothetical protein
VEPSSKVAAAPDGGGGVSLTRTDEGGAYLRRRIERPAIYGRSVLAGLGSVAVGAGAGLFFIDHSALGIALVTFGVVLDLLAGVQHRFLQRDRAHWPDQVMLWDGGVELVLHNGDVRGVSWTDPDLALNLISRRAPPPAEREYLLVWMSEGAIPSAELSEEGFARLRHAAESQLLAVTEPHRSRRPGATVWVEIRPGAASRPTPLKAAAGEASET